MIGQKLIEAAGSGISTGEVAEAIDFDGPDDYLSRSTDLVGNADGKTFTFSCWVWDFQSVNAYRIYNADTGSAERFEIRINLGRIFVYGYNSGGTQILYGYASQTDGSAAIQTWTNILVSVDLSNSANRYIYANDVSLATTWVTYTNTNINFSTVYHRIARGYNSLYPFKGRLSNVYLDKTYRDLSVEANRRLFVTADLKPADGQASLNPILYLPMDDPTAPGANAGTGGNFTLTGTIARSGRGPNQYNAPYSDLDGSADYLSRSSDPTGIADGVAFTFAFSVNLDTTANATYPLQNANGYINIWLDSGGFLKIRGYAVGLSIVLSFDSSSAVFVAGRNYQVAISIDLSSTSKRHIYVNGSSVSGTWTTFTNSAIDFTRGNWTVGASGSVTPAAFLNGKLGALWFNTSYIDLSVADNLAKFVTGTGIDAKPVDLGASGELPTGTAPLIYLPMYGNNAGKNYGTGGDFTVNSGPYPGARGPNEFWGNWANFNGTNSYLSKSGAISGLSNSKTFSLSLFFNKTSGAATDYLISWPTTGGNHTLYFNTATSMNQSWRNTLGNAALGGWSPTIPDATNVNLLICVDMDDVNKCKIYINGTVHAGTPGTFVTGTTLNFASINNPFIGVYDGVTSSTVFNGKLSEFYFTTEYIDFSQEANRLKFVDAFGNPVNLTQQIEDAAIPNPAIYMRFPPTSFGTNSGTGGDFTVNGTITDAGQL